MIDLRFGDCLVEMPKIESASIDAIIADIPYGTTACKWDTVIPFEPMWEQLKRIAKPKAAIVLFGSQPFTSALVMSNAAMFRYEWIWRKSRASNFVNSNRVPLKYHENAVVFSENGHTYNPQLRDGERYKRRIVRSRKSGGQYKVTNFDDSAVMTRQPGSVLDFPSMRQQDIEHPTQKPVALMEYLIRTYTNEGDTVLDFTMGSGTTMVACANTGRNGIGIEKDAGYFSIAERRVKDAQKQPALALIG